jgi:hypothetical protein
MISARSIFAILVGLVLAFGSAANAAIPCCKTMNNTSEMQQTQTNHGQNMSCHKASNHAKKQSSTNCDHCQCQHCAQIGAISSQLSHTTIQIRTATITKASALYQNQADGIFQPPKQHS